MGYENDKGEGVLSLEAMGAPEKNAEGVHNGQSAFQLCQLSRWMSEKYIMLFFILMLQS